MSNNMTDQNDTKEPTDTFDYLDDAKELLELARKILRKRDPTLPETLSLATVAASIANAEELRLQREAYDNDAEGRRICNTGLDVASTGLCGNLQPCPLAWGHEGDCE